MSLRVEDLHVSVEERKVLRGVSLSVDCGELVYLLGPNGSGKSTLLKTLIGLPHYKVEKGRILFKGEDITAKAPWERIRKGLWIVNQHVYPLSVPTYMLLESIVRKTSSGVRPKDLLAGLGIPHLYYRPAFQGFSGGEAKRLELATAMLTNADCILLDEPDSGVDVDGLRVIAKTITGWLSEGRSVLVVTHTGTVGYMLNARGRAYVMLDGRIVFEGDFADVIRLLNDRGYGAFKV